MVSEYASSRWGGLQIAYSFTERKDLSHTESELQQVEALPVGSVGNTVPVALPQDYNIIEYCI